jgi:hypothetical protein
MSYIGLQYADNATLFNGTLTTTGVGTAIDTTGYVQSVWQLSGNTFSGIITVENSLDGVYWTPTFVTELSSLGQKSQIEVDGVYLVKADSRYIRYNVTNISGTATLLILGNNYLSSNPVDRVSLAMDETNNTPLNVKLQLQNSGVKQDLSGAFILSDAPQSVNAYVPIGGQIVIDTLGYQSLHITTGSTFAATSGVQASTDGLIYTPIMPIVGGSTAGPWVGQTTLVASSNYTYTINARYAKIVATTAGSITYTLRNTAPQLIGQNLTHFGGTVFITGGVAGVPSVGGPVANAGTAGTNNPVQVGGVDSGALVRRFLTDTVGSLSVGGSVAVGSAPAATSFPLITGGIDPTGLSRRLTSTMLGDLITANRTVPTSNAVLGSATTGNAPITNAGFNNQVALSVQDTSEYDGQDQVELLAQILQELKILNQQIFELPRIQAAAFQGSTVPATGTNVQLGDEPTQMRNDASLFINQQ